MVKIFTLRVWILVFFIAISLLAIRPNPFASGIEIKSVSANSLAADNGLKQDLKIIKVNDIDIKTIADYNNAVSSLNKKPVELSIVTDRSKLKVNVTNKIKIGFDENLTITKSEIPGLAIGDKILAINSKDIKNITDYIDLINKIIPKEKITIKTQGGEFSYLTYSQPEITVRDVKKTNIIKGLDLEGGTRVLLHPKEKDVTDLTINDLVSVLSNRLNVYGLTDLRI